MGALGVWSLEFIWFLGFGVWCFAFDVAAKFRMRLQPQRQRSRREKIADGIQLPGKRQIANEPQQGHLEHVQELRSRRVINPLRVGIVIPHFPEKAANQGAQRERDHWTPVAPPERGQEMRPAQSDVDWLQNEK